MFLRIPMTESSYNKAIAICQGTSGSLLKVEQVKIIDLNIIKSLSKHPIFRIDGKKGISFFHQSTYVLQKLRCLSIIDLLTNPIVNYQKL